MWIQPDSTIKLYTSIPIERDSADTLFFDSATAQKNYFEARKLYEYQRHAYQRQNAGVIRVNARPEHLIQINYLSFTNTAYSNRIFYAFVTNVDYINDNVTQLTYDLDYIQTFLFDNRVNLEPCWIERETVPSDNIGEHILPEPINLGEYIIDKQYGNIDPNGNEVRILAGYIQNSSTSGVTVSGGVMDNIFTGMTITAWKTTEEYSLREWIKTHTSATSGKIANIYMAPSRAVLDFSGGRTVSSQVIPQTYVFNAGKVNEEPALNGYTPRNNKCYTYPFTFYHVETAAGQELSLRYEFFSNGMPKIKIDYNAVPPVQACVYPLDYKGSNLSTNNAFLSEMITITGFPMCSWNEGAYNQWLALQGYPQLTQNLLNTGISLMTNPTAGGLLQAGTEVLRSGANFLVANYQASKMTDYHKGSAGGGMTNLFSHKNWAPISNRMTQPKEYMQAIDQYFDLFGYTVNRVGIPRLHNRSRWTYIKTKGCRVNGALPQDASTAIQRAFDSGIRLWADLDRPLDYTDNNNVL